VRGPEHPLWLGPRGGSGRHRHCRQERNASSIGAIKPAREQHRLPRDLDKRVRRSDTYSVEMGQSDLSRRIAHGDSGYPGFDDPEPVFVASPAASTKADIGPPAMIFNVGSPRWQDVDVPGRYRGDAMEHRINHSPVRGPARRRWQHIARNALGAVGCPTFESVGS
jgi:hypothetical protein